MSHIFKKHFQHLLVCIYIGGRQGVGGVGHEVHATIHQNNTIKLNRFTRIQSKLFTILFYFFV